MNKFRFLNKEKWEIKKFEEIITEIFDGNIFVTKRHWKKLFPAIKSSDLTSQKSLFIKACQTFVDPDIAKDKVLCSYGDILMIKETLSTSLIAKTYLYLGEQECLTAYEMYLIKHNQNIFYVFFALNSFKWKRIVSLIYKNNYKSSEYHKINLYDLTKLKLSIPPKHIQELIGNYLYKLSTLNEQLESLLETIEKQKIEQFNYYLKEWVIVENGACLVKLETIAKNVYFGNEVTENQVNSGDDWAIKNKDITDFSIFFKKCKTFVDSYLLKKRVYAKNKDLIISTLGKQGCGKVVAYLGNKKILVGSYMVVFQHSQNPLYLSFLLNCENYKQQIKKLFQNSFSKAEFIEELKQIEIPLPSIEEQKRIIERIELLHSYFEKQKVNLKELIKLNKLRLQYYINELTKI